MLCCEAPMYMTLQVMDWKKVTRWSSKLHGEQPAACMCILQYFDLRDWCRQSRCTWLTTDLSSCKSPNPAKTDQTGCNAVPDTIEAQYAIRR